MAALISRRRRTARLLSMATALAAALALVAPTTAPSAPVARAVPGDPARTAPASAEQSIVQMTRSSSTRACRLWRRDALSPDGIVLTNHVVAGADTITASVGTGQTFKAQLLGYLDRTEDSSR